MRIGKILVSQLTFLEPSIVVATLVSHFYLLLRDFWLFLWDNDLLTFLHARLWGPVQWLIMWILERTLKFILGIFLSLLLRLIVQPRLTLNSDKVCVFARHWNALEEVAVGFELKGSLSVSPLLLFLHQILIPLIIRVQRSANLVSKTDLKELQLLVNYLLVTNV